MGIQFSVDMSGNVATNAKMAASALSSNAAAAKILKTEMGSLEDRMVKASAIGDTKALKKLTTDLGLVKKAFGELPPTMQKAAMGESEVARGATKLSGALEGQLQKMGGAGPVISGLIFKLGGLGGAYGAVAAVAVGAIATIVLGISALKAWGMRLAIEAVEAKEKLLSLFSAMAGSRSAGAATVAMLGKLSDELGVTRESLGGAAREFAAMGITDLGALRSQVRAVTAITAVMGDEGAAAYSKLVAKTQEAIDTGSKFKLADKQIAQWRQMGLNIGDIAKRMGLTSQALEQGLAKGTVDAKKFQAALGDVAREKFGDALAAQAMQPAKQWDKLKENFSRLFEDVNVKPLLEAFQRVVQIFSGDKASGKAMKVGLTATFNSVIASSAKMVDWLVGAFLKVEIAALKIAIWARPWLAWFDALDSKYGIIDKLITGVKAFGVVLGVIAAVFFAPLAYLAVVLTAGAVALATIVGWAVAAGEALGGLAAQALTAAENFVGGLVDGIVGGLGRVVDAAKNLAQGALDAVTGLFDSHSPSLVMKRIGLVGVAGGLALGMTAGIPAATDAAQNVAGAVVQTVGEQVAQPASGGRAPSTVAASPPSSSSGSTSSSSASFAFAPGSIVIQGAGKSAEGITEELISAIFERIALEQGV